MVLNDKQIVALCEAGMIAPFEARQVRERERVPGARERAVLEVNAAWGGVHNVWGLSDALSESLGWTSRVISYGASSYGYDLRLAPEGFRVFSPHHAREIDPKAFDQRSLLEPWIYDDAENGSRYYLIPPHSYALGVTVETFKMPRNVLGMCVGKSTYARCGLIVNTTPLEPGWRGRLVLELANTTPLPLRVYVNEGIAQCVFFQGDEPATSYADRGGKYQGQEGLTLARV